MAKKAEYLDDYVTVNQRILKFYEKFPEGSLQSEVINFDGGTILVKGLAFRTPDDPRPGVGHAFERQGDGFINERSFVENAETSAWGRALAALGFEVSNAVASREEVENAKLGESGNSNKLSPIDRLRKAQETLEEEFGKAGKDVFRDILKDFAAIDVEGLESKHIAGALKKCQQAYRELKAA